MLSALIGKSIKVTRAGREWKACCPFHNEKTPSFTINDEKGFYHCFGCGAHGDAIRWMTDQRGLAFMDAVKELAAAAGMDVPAPDPRAAQRAEQQQTLRDVTQAAGRWFEAQLAGPEGLEARRYLGQRGLSDATVEAFALGFAPDGRNRLKSALTEFPLAMLIEAGMLIDPDAHEAEAARRAGLPAGTANQKRDPYDRFRGRLMIPIRDARGRVIGFGGRILGFGEPKYLNSPDTPLVDKGRILFNLDRAAPAARDAKRLIVVEGYMDVIALDQAGIAEAVAPLGTALTEAQLELAWRQVPTPVLAFDGDAAGQRAAMRAAERALPLLQPGRSLAILTLPPGQDPDDVVKSGGKAAFEALLDRAEPLSAFLYRQRAAGIDLTLPDGRAAYKSELNQTAEAIGDKLVAGEYRRWFLDRFWGDFGWKKSNLGEVRHFVEATSRGDARHFFGSVYRSMLFALAQRPRVAVDRLEALSSIMVEGDALRGAREAIIDHAIERPGHDADAVAQLGALIGTDIERVDLGRDLLFPWSRDKARIDLLLPAFVTLIAQEQAVERDLAAVVAAISADSLLERYDSLHRRRMACIERRNGLRGELAALVESDVAGDARWAV